MRLYDREVPVIVEGDQPGPDTSMGKWPADLHVGIESLFFDQPQWDGGDPVIDPQYRWDDTAFTWDEITDTHPIVTDAICWFQGMSLDMGEPTADNRFTASEVTITLDNRDGRWSRYDPFGRLAFHPPGKEVRIWADLDDEPWWLFAGRIARWNEVGDQVVLTAVDAFSEFNVRLNEWEAGAAGDRPIDRLEAILAMIGWPDPILGRAFLAAGDVTLLAHPTSASPLEEMQAVVESDGGVLLVDADGTLLSFDRRWTGGRFDQETVPVVSGNVADVPIVVWDLNLTTDDDTLANLVTLANDPLATGPGSPNPITVTSESAWSRDAYGSYTLPQNRDKDLWQTEEQGQVLADYIVELRAAPTSRISSAALYLHDQRHDYWRAGIDLRRGDAMQLIQDVRAQDGSLMRIAVFLIVAGIHHDITPSSWITTFTTSRTVGNVLVQRWDDPDDPYLWDEDNPNNVWSY